MSYLKYMEKKPTLIQRDIFRFKSLDNLPEWLTVMGLQFENLVLGSRARIREALALDLNSVVNENPFPDYRSSRDRRRSPGVR
jgi:hypothetical protein